MHISRGYHVVLWSSLLLSSCASKSDPAPAQTPLPCAVDEIFAASCRECHGASTAYGAPMSLVTWEDVQATSKTDATKKVYQLIGTRIHDDANPMPQPPNPRLSDADTATLDAWVAASAPAKSASDSCPSGAGGSGGAGSGSGGAGGGAVVQPDVLACTPDVSLRPGSAWTMPTDTKDIYVCYGIDVPATGTRQVIGFSPHVDNSKIVHHALLYQSDTAVDPTPTECSGAGVNANRLVYGWAPGGKPFEMPDVAGYPMTPDGVTHYVVQVHYNNIQALSGEMDQTGFDLCTTDQLRPNDADVLAFGSMKFTIPAHQTLDITCDLPMTDIPETMHVISAFPHMHELGATIATTSTPAAGGPDVQLGSVPTWSFSNQIWFPLQGDISPGDTVHTRCSWNNTTNADVSFGEFTEDEMCYSFTMYYPANPNLKSWLVPAFQSTCHPTGQ